MSLRESFEENGYVLIKDFLSPEAVKRIRLSIEAEEASKNRTYFGLNELEAAEIVIEQIINKKFACTIKKIFSLPYIMPDFITQISNTPKKKITSPSLRYSIILAS